MADAAVKPTDQGRLGEVSPVEATAPFPVVGFVAQQADRGEEVPEEAQGGQAENEPQGEGVPALGIIHASSPFRGPT